MSEKDDTSLEVNGFQVSKTALVVVDVQNDFCHKEGIFSKYRKIALGHIERAIESLSVLIEKCRQLNLPIVFIKTEHSAWTDSPSWLTRLEGDGEKMRICPPGNWGSEFYRIKPKESDCIVTKHRFSGFVGTDLDLVLRSRGIKDLLVTGVATNVCVESTARDGFNRDYNIILIEDCCGAFDQGEHDATINNIKKYFGNVATSMSLLETLEIQESQNKI